MIVPTSTSRLRLLTPLAAILALAAASAAHAATLSVIAADASAVGAIDRDTIKHDGGEATADLVLINRDPEHMTDVGEIGVLHVRFDCAGKRVASTGGETQASLGAEWKPAPDSVHDWSPPQPGNPVMAAFDLVCLDKAVEPEKTFPGIPEFAAYYADTLKKAPEAQPAPH